MRALRMLCGVVLLVACSAAEPDPRLEAEASIRWTFEQFRAAALARDGAAAVQHLSQSTFDYYREIQMLALHGTQDDLKSRSVADQVNALLLRLRTDPEALRAMSSADLVADSISVRAGAPAVANMELGAIEQGEGYAIAELDLPDQPAAASMTFVEENGDWRLDLAETIRQANDEYEQSTGSTKDELVLKLLEPNLEEELSADLWEPPFPVEE